MGTLIGILAIIWGIFILYSSLFKMKKRDYKNQSPIGVSGYFEFEFLFRLLSKSPWRLIKGLTILIGLSFVTVGTIIM
ncbi:hypothetical protein COK01_08320 [Priestia megaterium]|uniref:Uncharacterized protein n=1 Tax=Priestia megaterium TaxID=1404 RepID=A0AAE5P5W0_PRIMG|nr:uncharacterized membrane protein HdeD (DUF308 family) [Priestia megaterium]RFB30185.1 hypothetical protein DZB87_06795 [Bacillus sp. ALD]RFB40419.1 hypothetical protein DZB86_06190 [Bacillus sp. RC]PES34236.1 hypothetical protein CN497_20595 [Priestia megaterium]PES96111.1 hypothetical protein CN510_15540 [Priestia megaterium]